jgi:acyl-ACP thioesterase
MYSFNSRIRYSEVDKDAQLTLQSLIDYFQDCSTFQTEDGPATMEYLRERHAAWVLNFWQIEINRYPRLGERVVIGTVPYQLKGMFGLRNFFMDTEDGERLAIANSIWTLFDFEKSVPTRVTPEIIEAYPLEEKLPMDYADRKIKLPDEGISSECDQIVVRTNHLDTNDHVNNGQYIRMAMDCLPRRDIIVSSMRAEYKAQALLGDVIFPVVITEEKDGCIVYTVSLNDKEGKPYCIAEFKVK